ncbi:MAG: MFS transporter, partial [Chloroflexota bacterium]
VLMDSLLLPYQHILPLFAERVLDAGPVELGYLGAATGAGAFLGLLVLPLVRRPSWQGWVFAAGSCLACLAMLLFAGSTRLVGSLGLLLVVGLGTTAFGTMQTSIILTRAEPAMRGRAMGLLALTIGSAPLGALETGLLVERLGAPLAVGLNATLCGLLVASVAWRARLFRTPS